MKRDHTEAAGARKIGSASPGELTRVHAVVTGLVQGVCYRAETLREALRLGLTGWVRNRSDGAVEGVFEGPRASVEAILRWCRKGPPHARVSGLEVDWKAPTGEFSSFDIRR